MAKILIVEDDAGCAGLIRDLLKSQLHTVEVVGNGSDGLFRVQNFSYDLLILDWELPELPGVEICRRYRSAGGQGAVLMLTGRNSTPDKEAGLDLGADDYLTKPFDGRELLAHVRALLRRQQKNFVGSVLKAGDLELDTQSMRVSSKGQELGLLPKEFALLEYFLRHPNQVCTYDGLLAAVWSNESDATATAVRKCVERIRKKLEGLPGDQLIETVHGVGYVFNSKSDNP